MLAIAPMTEDAKVILLLCGRFGSDRTAMPLGQGEYSAMVRWMAAQRLRPSDLVKEAVLERAAVGSQIDRVRLGGLLARGVHLAFAVEAWNRSGIWLTCRSDEDYPVRLKTHLRDQAPPMLFGTGDRALLAGGGLAVVGSRNVDDLGARAAREAAEWCARHGMLVVSGGARGVDTEAMVGSLEAGGRTVGVMADGLLRRSVSRDVRHWIAEGKLLLLSPNHPEAGFSVGTAMARNKLIYAMADFGLVISADTNKGGTWAGAVEELRREHARPVFVRVGPSVPKGNSKLLQLGAKPFPRLDGGQGPMELLTEISSVTMRGSTPSPVTLFDNLERASSQPANGQLPSAASPSGSAPGKGAPGLYEVVLPVVLSAFEQARDVKSAAAELEVSPAQLSAWVKRALADGRLTRLAKPVRYVAKTD